MGQLGQREIKREARFGALVLIEMILQHGIATTTSRRIVEWLPQIIASQEPFEAAPGGAMPEFVARYGVGFETGGQHRVRFQWLLIEAGAFAALGPESVAADR